MLTSPSCLTQQYPASIRMAIPPRHDRFAMTTTSLDDAVRDDLVLDDARRFNRKLDWLPRFKIRNRVTPLLVKFLLRLSQSGGTGALTRAGIRVEQCMARADGKPVPVRILRPAGAVRGVVLDVHGGGWVIGNARMNDQLNARMVAACGVSVVSVDYRLAPATPLEGMIDDCVAAARWLLQGGAAGLGDLPVVVLGESAGAHLAAAMLLRLKAWPDLSRRVRGALLYYGVYDVAGTPSVRKAPAGTLVLDGPGMVTALGLLTPGLTDAQRRQPALSPLYGDLEGMPPALLFAGCLDPLRDDTTLMAKRWGKVARVEMHLLPEAPHGFIRFPTRMAALVQARSHAWIRERIAHVGD